MKKKILIVFGTRPEAIKMAPLVKEFLLFPELFETRVCVSAQHREMLDQVLHFFSIVPDYDLNLMRKDQNLHTLTAEVITGMKEIFESFKPDYVLVHGDTTTSFAAALSAFYCGIKVAHVEAGLRTYQKWAPFPEEINRQLSGRICDIHFAPTQVPKENLLQEGISESAIFVTGNTVIDALFLAQEELKNYSDSEIALLESILEPNKKLILVTGHRRENFGDGFESICKALSEIAQENPEVQIVYPVHLNPNVMKPVHELLSGISNIKLIAPLAYPAFVWLMNKSYLIITDSGGVQEEAPAIQKPVLVMREVTERPEAVLAGTVKLVGTDVKKIKQETELLLHNLEAYQNMTSRTNPYGDGTAAKKIVAYFREI